MGMLWAAVWLHGCVLDCGWLGVATADGGSSRGEEWPCGLLVGVSAHGRRGCQPQEHCEVCAQQAMACTGHMWQLWSACVRLWTVCVLVALAWRIAGWQHTAGRYSPPELVAGS